MKVLKNRREFHYINILTRTSLSLIKSCLVLYKLQEILSQRCPEKTLMAGTTPQWLIISVISFSALSLLTGNWARLGNLNQ